MESLCWSLRSIRLQRSNSLQCLSRRTTECITPKTSRIMRRTMATEVQMDGIPAPISSTSSTPVPTTTPRVKTPQTPVGKIFKDTTPPSDDYKPLSQVLTTLYTFPHLKPQAFAAYPATFLHSPLRRDILQRAIIFEGNAHRLGRAKTKWRDEVHGSHKKMRPQKGSGRARLGTRQSPMLRGGGKAFGPKPRDFSTKLPRKMYDMAFRTALSYRYRRGELTVVEDTLEVKFPKTRYVVQIMRHHKWDRSGRRTLFVTSKRRPYLWQGIKGIPHHGHALTVEEIDVKDLLEMGRVVIERGALDWLLEKHRSKSKANVELETVV